MPSAIRALEGVRRGVEVWNVHPNQLLIVPGFNPRGIDYADLDVEDLKAFIKENGVRALPPLRVSVKGDTITVIAGHRRHKAVTELIAEGVEIVALPCQVDNAATEADSLCIAIAENQGQPISPQAEARAFDRLIAYGWSQDAIAKRVGRSTAHVSNRLAMLQASPVIQEAHQNGVITTSEVVQLARAENQEQALDWLQHAKEIKKVNKQKVQAVKTPAAKKAVKLSIRLKELFDTHGIKPILVEMVAYASEEEIMDILSDIAIPESEKYDE